MGHKQKQNKKRLERALEHAQKSNFTQAEISTLERAGSAKIRRTADEFGRKPKEHLEEIAAAFVHN